MSSFSTEYNERVDINIHRVPMDILKIFEIVGKINYLNNYPKDGKRLRFLEVIIGGIEICLYADGDDCEEMPNDTQKG